MLSREELLQVECSPINEKMWDWYCGSIRYESFSIRYLYMVMIFRYYQAMNKRYNWNLDLVLGPVQITDDFLDDRDDMIEAFFYMCGYCRELMERVGTRFGWRMASIAVDAYCDQNYQKYVSNEISLEEFLLTYGEVDSENLELLLSYEEVFADLEVMVDGGEVWILEHPGLGMYLKFREEQKEKVASEFGVEDERIMQLIEWLGHPLSLQHAERYKRVGDRCFVAFICGSNGEMEFDFCDLLPEWVIGSFVVHDLLMHAEQLFQYRKSD